MPMSEIKQKAIQLGYESCGIISAKAFDEYRRYLDERIKAFPESKKLYEPFYRYVTPPEESKSIIVCIQGMTGYKVPDFYEGLIGKCYLFDARVPIAHEHRARVEFETYLKTLGLNILQFQVPARWAAAKAGLIKFGRNNFVYSPKNGSYMNVISFVVDKELEYDAAPEDLILPECSDSCEKCIKACPTNAMTGELCMDMGKCINTLTVRAEDALDADTRSKMGEWVYGCDVCQDVCPVNKGKFSGNEEFPLLAQFEEYMKPENLLTMDESAYISVVNPRFWYIGEEGIWLWRCNALRSLINSGKPEYHGLIKQCLDHKDARVREVAQWGCDKLGI